MSYGDYSCVVSNPEVVRKRLRVPEADFWPARPSWFNFGIACDPTEIVGKIQRSQNYLYRSIQSIPRLELDSYFFNSVVQLRTRFNGAGVSPVVTVLVRNFLPSGNTS